MKHEQGAGSPVLVALTVVGATETSSGHRVLLFLKKNIPFVQTPREPAENRGVLSEPDAPDEDHICGLLLQSSVCSQRSHTTHVRPETRVFYVYRN